MSLRPATSTEWIPRQPGLKRETPSRKKIKNRRRKGGKRGGGGGGRRERQRDRERHRERGRESRGLEKREGKEEGG